MVGDGLAVVLASACAKQLQLRLALGRKPCIGSEQSSSRSLGAQRFSPFGLRALTIEPATWKHQQPVDASHPAVTACQPTRASPGSITGYMYSSRLRLRIHDSTASLLSAAGPPPWLM